MAGEPYKPKVILIDDEESTLDLYSIRLKQKGIDVIAVGVGHVSSPPADFVVDHDALKPGGELSFTLKEKLRTADLILTDYDYKFGATGLDFLDRVRAINECKFTPVIMHSNAPHIITESDVSMARAEALGITQENIVNKSMSMSDLVKKINDTIAAAPLRIPT